MKTGLIAILLFLAVQTAWGQFCLHSGMAATVNYNKSEAPVVHTALELLQRDYRAVFLILCNTAKNKVIFLSVPWD